MLAGDLWEVVCPVFGQVGLDCLPNDGADVIQVLWALRKVAAVRLRIAVAPLLRIVVRVPVGVLGVDEPTVIPIGTIPSLPVKAVPFPVVVVITPSSGISAISISRIPSTVSARISMRVVRISVSTVLPVGVVTPSGGIPVTGFVFLVLLEGNPSPFPVCVTLLVLVLVFALRLGP